MQIKYETVQEYNECVLQKGYDASCSKTVWRVVDSEGDVVRLKWCESEPDWEEWCENYTLNAE